ncbi:MAG: hypothetical protein AB8B63_24415 [Granulosicoccus sp.]
MCHSSVLDASFWSNLSQLDRVIADQIQCQGCQHCAGKLHVANYPRKPRGEHRDVLGPDYTQRLSFCCSLCRKRTTPPSLRFLGRKVYLAGIVVVLSAGVVALDQKQRDALLEALQVPTQTLHRWRRWWSGYVPLTPTWKALSGWFSPPVQTQALPGELLARLQGSTLGLRLQQLLVLMQALTTRSCSCSLRVIVDTHKM